MGRNGMNVLWMVPGMSTMSAPQASASHREAVVHRTSAYPSSAAHTPRPWKNPFMTRKPASKCSKSRATGKNHRTP